MRIKKIAGRPLLPLPDNAERAVATIHLTAYRLPIAGPDRGAAKLKGGLYPNLITWGANLTREQVEKFGGRRFAWVGVSYENGTPRDNFEELL